MNEDPTHNLPQPFEERVLAELRAMRGELSTMNTRLTSLEEKVDARLRETRPIWEGVQAQLTRLETEMKTLNRHFKSLINDMFKLRSLVEELEDNQPTA